jgi:hypothetical protein
MNPRHVGALALVGWYLMMPTGGQSLRAQTLDPRGALLPRYFVVLLNPVSQLFSQITEQASTGKNSTAVGKPKATRAVFFTNGDGGLKVTITADRYRSFSDAAAAYQVAVEKSESVPGFQPISIPAVGEKSFAGTVTQGDETHVGIGVLDGQFVLGATLAGFDATTDNVNNLVILAREEEAATNAAAKAQSSQNSN